MTSSASPIRRCPKAGSRTRRLLRRAERHRAPTGLRRPAQPVHRSPQQVARRRGHRVRPRTHPSGRPDRWGHRGHPQQVGIGASGPGELSTTAASGTQTSQQLCVSRARSKPCLDTRLPNTSRSRPSRGSPVFGQMVECGVKHRRLLDPDGLPTDGRSVTRQSGPEGRSVTDLLKLYRAGHADGGRGMRLNDHSQP